MLQSELLESGYYACDRPTGLSVGCIYHDDRLMMVAHQVRCHDGMIMICHDDYDDGCSSGNVMMML